MTSNKTVTRAVKFDAIDDKSIFMVSAVPIAFTDKKTNATMTYQSSDEKYNYAKPGEAPIIDEFVINGPVCIAKRGITVPQKKEDKKLPPGAIPPTQGYMPPAQGGYPPHGYHPAPYGQAPPAGYPPQGYPGYPPQGQAPPPQQSQQPQATEERVKEVWKFWPKDPKDAEPMRLNFHKLHDAAVNFLVAKKELVGKTADKEGEMLISTAKDFIKLPYFVPTNNKKPIPGARASYRVNHRYDSVYEWLHDPKEKKDKSELTVDPEKLRNKYVVFIPKILVKSLYIGNDLASVQFHMKGATIIDIQEAGADNAPDDVNEEAMNSPEAEANLATAREALARLRALKNKKKEDDTEGDKEKKDENKPAGSTGIVPVQTANITAPPASNLPVIPPLTAPSERKLDTTPPPQSFQLPASGLPAQPQPQVVPSSAGVPQVFNMPSNFGEPQQPTSLQPPQTYSAPASMQAVQATQNYQYPPQQYQQQPTNVNAFFAQHQGR